jgi:hypothetical protein
MKRMKKETLKIEHHGAMLTMTVYQSEDGKRYAYIDDHIVKVYSSIYPKDKWTTDLRQAKGKPR